MKTLVALHAHPDDESSKGAATVARYSRAGVRCVLVTATGGEAGDILNPALDRPEVHADLAAYRRRELAAATALIGYDRVELLGYRDSGMPDSEHNSHPDAFVNADFDEVLERVVRIVREEQPEVLLGYDEHKRYPHPDHLRIHALGIAVFDAAGDPNRFPAAGEPWAVPKLYAPTFTRKRIELLHQAMLDRYGSSPLQDWIDRFDDSESADPHDHEVVSVKVTETLEVGREALRAHATQVDPDGPWFHVPLELVSEVYPFEDFVRLASRVDVSHPEEDLFAGI